MSVEKMSFNNAPKANSMSPEKEKSLTDIRGVLSTINLEKTLNMASKVAMSYKTNLASKN